MYRRNNIVIRLGLMIIGIMIIASLSGSTVVNFYLSGKYWIHEPLHSSIEAMGSLAALCLAILVLLLQRYEGYTAHRVWISCAFASMGTLDLFHASSTPGVAFVWFRSVATFAGGLFFVLTLIRDRKVRPVVAFFPPAAIALSGLILGSLCAYHPHILPLMVKEGRFTVSAMAINLAGGIFFLIAAANFLRMFLARGRPDELIFLNLCLLFGLAGVLFPASELWSLNWWLWHVLRFGAYLITLPYLFFIFQRFETGLQKIVAELRRSNEELEQFAYVASHDLKEPLLSVASNIKLLQRRITKGHPEETNEFIEKSLQQLTMMQALISDLLIYSRVGTQARPFEKVACDAVLSRAVENLSTRIEQKQATITADPLPEVMADQVQMVQLMQNILGNALKFCEDKAPVIHVSAVRGEGEWIFSVRDNGIGIPPEEREHIFEMFGRLHKDKFHGTGIGLATCKKIVERHNGRIWVTSDQGQGSTFFFTVPIHDSLQGIGP
ncbi:MAG: GHKL domain-containing protein [Nitrospirae bacterium]|nr:GHKL domain-containing protein [Nitrospirota bacterium]